MSPNYTFIFDRNGVPVWWKKATQQQTDFTVFPNGNSVGCAEATRVARSAGSTARSSAPSSRPEWTWTRTSSCCWQTATTSSPRSRTLDNKSYCGHTNKPILDNGVQEVTPGGTGRVDMVGL